VTPSCGYLDNESGATAEAQVVAGDVTLQCDVTGQLVPGAGHSQPSCQHAHNTTIHNTVLPSDDIMRPPPPRLGTYNERLVIFNFN